MKITSRNVSFFQATQLWILKLESFPMELILHDRKVVIENLSFNKKKHLHIASRFMQRYPLAFCGYTVSSIKVAIN